MDDREALSAYCRLCELLLAGTITPLDFEGRFLQLWGTEQEWPTGADYRRLERLFFVVEDLVDDPELREPGSLDLDEDGLRAGVRRFLEEVGPS